jgi:hypothetical protein
MKKVMESEPDSVYKISEQADDSAALLLGFGKLLLPPCFLNIVNFCASKMLW